MIKSLLLCLVLCVNLCFAQSFSATHLENQTTYMENNLCVYWYTIIIDDVQNNDPPVLTFTSSQPGITWKMYPGVSTEDPDTTYSYLLNFNSTSLFSDFVGWSLEQFNIPSQAIEPVQCIRGEIVVVSFGMAEGQNSSANAEQDGYCILNTTLQLTLNGNVPGLSITNGTDANAFHDYIVNDQGNGLYNIEFLTDLGGYSQFNFNYMMEYNYPGFNRTLPFSCNAQPPSVDLLVVENTTAIIDNGVCHYNFTMTVLNPYNFNPDLLLGDGNFEILNLENSTFNTFTGTIEISDLGFYSELEFGYQSDAFESIPVFKCKDTIVPTIVGCDIPSIADYENNVCHYEFVLNLNTSSYFKTSLLELSLDPSDVIMTFLDSGGLPGAYSIGLSAKVPGYYQMKFIYIGDSVVPQNGSDLPVFQCFDENSPSFVSFTLDESSKVSNGNERCTFSAQVDLLVPVGDAPAADQLQFFNVVEFQFSNGSVDQNNNTLYHYNLEFIINQGAVKDGDFALYLSDSLIAGSYTNIVIPGVQCSAPTPAPTSTPTEQISLSSMIKPNQMIFILLIVVQMVNFYFL